MKDNKNVYIALGSNLQKRNQNLKSAIKEIQNFAEITKKSKVYETEPIGYKDQGNFLNQVIKVNTNLTPTELIIKLHEIEHKMGRIREIKNGPRTIDLDILLYDDEIINTKSLKIPHPKLQERQFVLEPLNEIAPKKIHPILKKTIQSLWTKIKSRKQQNNS